MVKFLKQILNKGIEDNFTESEEKSVVLTNFILLIASSIAFVRIIIFFTINDYSFSFVSLVSTLLFLGLYFLNIKGYRDTAKYSLLIIGNLATGLKELLAGGNAGQIYLILASFGVVFLLFELKDIKKLTIGLCIPLINTLIIVFFPTMIHAPVIVSPDMLKIEKFTGVFSNIVISVLIIWYFVKKSAEIELKLKETNNLLNSYNTDLLTQKNIIESKNEEIYASIRYAKSLQNTILPWDSTLKEALKDYFLIYKPKDIVSGDFYWLAEHENEKYFAVADCTGHGVSGSMLSMIGVTILDEAVLGKNISKPSEILKYFDFKFTNALNQQIAENKSRDSIEVSLIKITNNTLEYSGARLNLYFVQNGNLNIIKADRNSIGGDTNAGDDYTNYSYNYNKGDSVYLMSDGFVDQIGINGKKFGTKTLIKLIEYNSSLSIEMQNINFNNALNNHIGNEPQRDDITISCIRL